MTNVSSFKVESIIVEHLGVIFPNKNFTIAPLKNGERHILGTDLKVKVDPVSTTLTFFMNFGGREYQLVKKDDAALYWLSTSDNRMIKWVKGEVESQYQTVSCGEYELLLNEGEEFEGKWLDKVPPPSVLSWFQKPEDIICLVDPLSPTQIAKIDFKALKLTFLVTENKAYNRGDFPGFYIAEPQRLACLTPYSRYLLLEKGAEKMVILPCDGANGALLRGVMGKAFQSEFVNGYVDSYLNKYTTFQEMLPAYFAYSIDKDNKLSSGDPAAILYLVSFHLAVGRLGEAKYYLERLELMAKTAPLPLHLPFLSAAVNAVAFVNQDADWIFIALRLTAMEKENAALQGTDFEQKIPAAAKVAEYVILQINYLRYLQSKGGDLSPFQELFLIQNILHLLPQIILRKNEYGYNSLTNQIAEILEKGSELLIHASILKRQEELLREHLPGRLSDISYWRKIFNALNISPVLRGEKERHHSQ